MTEYSLAHRFTETRVKFFYCGVKIPDIIVNRGFIGITLTFAYTTVIHAQNCVAMFSQVRGQILERTVSIPFFIAVLRTTSGSENYCGMWLDTVRNSQGSGKTNPVIAIVYISIYVDGGVLTIGIASINDHKLSNTLNSILDTISINLMGTKAVCSYLRTSAVFRGDDMIDICAVLQVHLLHEGTAVAAHLYP